MLSDPRCDCVFTRAALPGASVGKTHLHMRQTRLMDQNPSAQGSEAKNYSDSITVSPRFSP